MYQIKHLRWRLVHVWGILAHLGLVVAASISFLYDVGQTTQTTIPWGYSTAAQAHPCRCALMAGGGFQVEDRLSYDMATRPLLTISAMVVSSLWSLTISIHPMLTTSLRGLSALPSILPFSYSSSRWTPTGSC